MQTIPGSRRPTRLVAFVVKGERRSEDFTREHLYRWREVYEALYGEGPAAGRDAAFDTIGWNSSFTGEPIPAADRTAISTAST